MTNLLHQRCLPLDASSALSEIQIHQHLAQFSGWELRDGSIEKSFGFKNFHETMGFVNALAWICNTEDHHADLAVNYGRCVVRFNTHSAGGITVNDFICAAKVDALVAFVA
jgi:4a-hydroxytetrahydrobiopterin dehydratase